MAVDDELRTELVAMFAADQEQAVPLFEASGDLDESRDRFLFELPAGQRPEGYDEFAALCRLHVKRLAEIVGGRGWPGVSLVGHDGAAAAWGIAQHADEDNGICRDLLPSLEEAVGRGEAPGEHFAALVDRVRLRDRRPQLYGTVLAAEGGRWMPRAPVEEPVMLDERRKGLGLARWADWIAPLPKPRQWHQR